ncbi:unnamed protein product [Microthlaspi erraticum]|uniref:Integrase catalytic domain-containing protein n=1 Tax=Microthlaspi erraticum TaxID=1685480 RepID=A0A6D2J356_9BRAS|nr:unnamed protein product [Microthlaspi erraticum]
MSSQDKVSSRHASLFLYLQQFTFVIKHKARSLNKVADALSRRHALLSTLHVSVPGFETLPELYSLDPFFGKLWINANEGVLLDSRFLGHFWRSLWRLLKTSLDMSSAYHPQTDGQMEVTNRALGDLLCCLVGDNIRTWDKVISQAEFAHNHAVNCNTSMSPFRVIYGVTPRALVDLSLPPDRTRFHTRACDTVYNAPTVLPGESPTPSLWARRPISARGPHPCPTAGPLFLRGSNDLFTIPAINTRPFPVFWPHSHGFGNHFPKVTHPSTTPAQARLTLELLIDL